MVMVKAIGFLILGALGILLLWDISKRCIAKYENFGLNFENRFLKFGLGSWNGALVKS